MTENEKIIREEIKKYKEALIGGLADGISDSEFNEEQLKKGTDVEKEHTNSEEVAKEVAKDHLEEHPKYYDGLKKMENELTRQENEIPLEEDVIPLQEETKLIDVESEIGNIPDDNDVSIEDKDLTKECNHDELVAIARHMIIGKGQDKFTGKSVGEMDGIINGREIANRDRVSELADKSTATHYYVAKLEDNLKINSKNADKSELIKIFRSGFYIIESFDKTEDANIQPRAVCGPYETVEEAILWIIYRMNDDAEQYPNVRIWIDPDFDNIELERKFKEQHKRSVQTRSVESSMLNNLSEIKKMKKPQLNDLVVAPPKTFIWKVSVDAKAISSKIIITNVKDAREALKQVIGDEGDKVKLASPLAQDKSGKVFYNTQSSMKIGKYLNQPVQIDLIGKR